LKQQVLHFSILTLISIFLTGKPALTQGSWEKLAVPTQQSLQSVYFTDSLYGWVVGDSGIILHTADGGNNWGFQNGQTTDEIIDVFFLNRNLGWATAFNYSSPPYGTLLLSTTNGGNDWVSKPYPEENLFMNCIFFLDSLNGWMGGSPHAIVGTTDGGETWTSAEVDTSTLAFFPVLNIKFYDENYGYACGGMFDIAGVTWRTTNGGKNWYAIPVSQAPADEVHQLHLFDSIRVMGAGGDPDFGYGVGMLNTIDGGVNWYYDELNIQGNAYDLEFRNETDAWAPLGPGRKLIYSQDAGISWNETPTPDLTAIYDIHFPDSLHGFAVGRDGAMIKFVPPVQVGFEEYLTDEDRVKLFQNTPNPFTSQTTIRFEIPANFLKSSNNSNKIRLLVFDQFGELKTEVFKSDVKNGINHFPLDCSELPAGIYLYKLEIFTSKGERFFTSPKKMILSR
jgi:photosystem II stability/assembly factor-like uncharacterized protein